MAHISVLTKASESAVRDINLLVAQLRQESSTAGTMADLEKILEDGASVIVAEDGGKIIGVTFLYIAQKMGKRIGFVEDIVVDEAHRGKGIGRALMSEVVSLARQKGATYITLTSRSVRNAANKLYQSIGFELRETNVYRLNL